METTPHYVLRRPDGTFKYYVDPDYAKDQGVNPDKLICVDIPSSIYATGTVDDLSTFIAKEIEKLGQPWLPPLHPRRRSRGPRSRRPSRRCSRSNGSWSASSCCPTWTRRPKTSPSWPASGPSRT